MLEILLLRPPKAQGNKVGGFQQLLCTLQPSVPSVPASPGRQHQCLPLLNTGPLWLFLDLGWTKSQEALNLLLTNLLFLRPGQEHCDDPQAVCPFSDATNL